MTRDSVEVKERDKDGDGDGIEFKVKYIGHMEWRAERYWCRGEVKDEGNIENGDNDEYVDLIMGGETERILVWNERWGWVVS